MPATDVTKPENDVLMSVDEITHAIERFVDYAQNNKGITPKQALSDLVYLTMDHIDSDNIFAWSYDFEAIQLVAICNSTNPDTNKNLIEALKQACYKYGAHDSMDGINENKYYPASTVAIFQNETLKKAPHRMSYTAELNEIEKLPLDKKAVLYFCLEHFNPRIKFTGNFANDDHKLFTVWHILKILQHHTSISFRTEDQLLFGPGNRQLFLLAVSKATRLDINGAALDRWTPDDFKHFVHAVNANPKLKSLSLMHTNLDVCCKDPAKLPYILQLISMEQLHQLTLHHNNLRGLPEKQLDQLKEAIKVSPIQDIGLRYMMRDIEVQSAPSSTGIFATQAKEAPAINAVKEEDFDSISLSH